MDGVAQFRHEATWISRHACTVTRSAPRIDPRLVAALEALDDAKEPIAETNRRVGSLAETIGVPRPSYQQIRLRVHADRARRRARRARIDLVLDVQFRRRPPEALLELLHPELRDHDA